MKKVTVLLIICSTFMNSCDKVDFVPVIYEWYPLEYRMPINYDDIYYLTSTDMGIFFHDAGMGFISATYIDEYDYDYYFLRTDDSCRTFMDISSQVGGLVKEMSFVSDSIMYLLSVFRDNYFNDYSYIYKSIDGGKYWEILTLPESILISGISSNPNGNVFIVSQESQKLFLSKDGGETWTEQFSVNDTSIQGHLGLRIQFIAETQDTGFINFMDTLFITSDGGDSWKSYLYNTDHGFEKYYFLDRNTVYMHYSHNFYKSTDGGRTFEIVCPLHNNFKWLIIDENESYCSFSKYVYRSVDEFRTKAVMDFYHTDEMSYYDYRPRNFVITAPGAGYAICSSGKLFKLGR